MDIKIQYMIDCMIIINKNTDNTNKFLQDNILLLKNSIGTVGIKGMGMFIQFLLFPKYIQYFNNEDLAGIWLTIISILSWIGLFDLGIGQGLRNSLSVAVANKNEKDARKLISTAYGISFCIVLILCIIEIIFIPRLNFIWLLGEEWKIMNRNVFKIGMLILILGTTLQLFTNLIMYVFYAFQKPIVGNSMALISNIILLIVMFTDYGDVTLEKKFLILCIWYSVSINISCIIGTVIVFATTLKDVSPRIKYICKDKISTVFKIGGKIFWLQILWIIVSRTNEFLIMKLTEPDCVIEYQTYNKVFNLVCSFIIIAFIPIWSAITKAQEEGRFAWIKWVYKKMLGLVLVSFVGGMFLLVIIQFIIDIWMGDVTFKVNYVKAFIVLISNCVFVLHSANTNVSNGMSNFRLQSIVMTITTLLIVPLSILFTNILNNWIGVVIANIIALMVYETMQIYDTFNRLSFLLNEKTEKITTVS